MKKILPTYYNRISSVLDALGKKSGILLDAGCSDGYADRHLKNRFKIYGVDINRSDIGFARSLNPEVDYRVANLTKLPFRDHFFDAIICIDVLEHVKDDSKALSEMYRVLKRRGEIILTVPSADFPFFYDPINSILKLFGRKIRIGMWGYGHLRLYTMGELRKKLEECGFRITWEQYLSKHFIAAAEPGYIVNLLQPLVKSDPANQGRIGDRARIGDRLTAEPPGALLRVRDFIIKADKKLFPGSKTSINLLLKAKKY